MSKIDFDNIFRGKFLEHEENSRVYNPDHWKNFEQQLEKHLPSNKKRGFGFSLNNLFIYFSLLAIIVLIPFFILQSNVPEKSAIHSKRITPTVRNDKQFARIIHHTNNYKPFHNNNMALTDPLISKETAENNIPIQPEAVQKDPVRDKTENIPQILPVRNEKEVPFEMGISTKNITLVDAHSVQQKEMMAYNKLFYTKLYKNSQAKNKKHGKSQLSGSFAPHVNYNGF